MTELIAAAVIDTEKREKNPNNLKPAGNHTDRVTLLRAHHGEAQLSAAVPENPIRVALRSGREMLSPLVGQTDAQFARDKTIIGIPFEASRQEVLERWPERRLRQEGFIPSLYSSLSKSPLRGLPRATSGDVHSALPWLGENGVAVVTGTIAGGRDLAEGMSSPVGVATFGIGALPRVAKTVACTALAYSGVKHVATAVPGGVAKINAGHIEEGTRELFGGVTTAAFLGYGAREGLKGKTSVEVGTKKVSGETQPVEIPGEPPVVKQPKISVPDEAPILAAKPARPLSDKTVEGVVEKAVPSASQRGELNKALDQLNALHRSVERITQPALMEALDVTRGSTEPIGGRTFAALVAQPGFERWLKGLSTSEIDVLTSRLSSGKLDGKQLCEYIIDSGGFDSIKKDLLFTHLEGGKLHGEAVPFDSVKGAEIVLEGVTYKLTREVGAGGVGRVFEGRQVTVGEDGQRYYSEPKAIKFQVGSQEGLWVGDAKNEANNLQQLQQVPGIDVPRVHGSGLIAEPVHGWTTLPPRKAFAIVSDYIDGMTFADRIINVVHQSPRQVGTIVRETAQIASQLEHLRTSESGVCLGDFHARNIMIENGTGRRVHIDADRVQFNNRALNGTQPSLSQPILEGQYVHDVGTCFRMIAAEFRKAYPQQTLPLEVLVAEKLGQKMDTSNRYPLSWERALEYIANFEVAVTKEGVERRIKLSILERQLSRER
jgi:hypothetical protein